MDNLALLNQIKQTVIVAILGDDELSERLVLKGGNLLQFAFELTARASKDIDISVDGDFADTDALRMRVEGCLASAFDELNLVVIDFDFREVPAQISEDLKTFWGGYQCEFKLVDRKAFNTHSTDIARLRKVARHIGSRGSSRFKIDFSRHEFCADKEEYEIAGHTIFGYSPRMFVAEKLRAICQQMPGYAAIVHRNRPAASRARDFVDIQVIVEHYGIDFGDSKFHDTVRKTFEAKKVPLEFIGRISEFREAHEPDFQSVRDTVSPSFRLAEFDFYFEFVCNRCTELESLWNE